MSDDDYVEECKIEGQAGPISLDKLKIIIEQIEKCICYIKSQNKNGTGFFCKVPYPDFFNIKPALITNHHVLEEKDISEGSIIKFTLNRDTIPKEIKITNKRKIYTNKDFDVTIIELNPKEDSIEFDSFLDIDPKINCENPNKEFKNTEIYIIGNIKEYTYGLLGGIDSKGKTIRYLFSTKHGMSGSPIINLNNFKILGIHKGAHCNKKCNLGTLLRDPIKLFYSSKNFNSENINNQNPLKNEEISQNINTLFSFNSLKEKETMDIKSPKNLNDDDTKKKEILGPMIETHICKIECKDGSHDTGFFCNIPFGWNILKVLITNNHALNKDDILPNQKIKFSINNDNKNYEIKIDDSRKTYTNEDYDVTIIEMKEKDKIDKNSFFDIDSEIFKENVIETYRDKQIYLLHHPKGLKMEYSVGLIKRITEDNYNIHLLCESNGDTSGSPIINSMNFKVIGIHKGGAKGTKNYNVGILLKEPIENFNEESKKKEKKNK